jgi:hypothetical protein
MFPIQEVVCNCGMLTVMHCVDCRHVATHRLHHERRHLITDVPQYMSAEHMCLSRGQLTRELPVAWISYKPRVPVRV